MSKNNRKLKTNLAKLIINNITYNYQFTLTKGEPPFIFQNIPNANIFTYDPGFTSTAVWVRTNFIDADKGILDIVVMHWRISKKWLHRSCKFTNLHDLPNKDQLKKYKKLITRHTLLHEQIINFSKDLDVMLTQWQWWWCYGCFIFILSR